jgi:hypothetical protein
MTRQHCCLRNAHAGAHLMINTRAQQVLLGECPKLGDVCVFPVCAFPGCFEEAQHQCECCLESRQFCSDHGSAGGDREGGDNANGSPYGAYAVPSACWHCGGFNADAEAA